MLGAFIGGSKKFQLIIFILGIAALLVAFLDYLFCHP